MSLIYRKLDDNGDYRFGQGSQTFLTNSDAVSQAIQTTLGLYESEWWEDTSLGLPLWQQILGAPGSKTSAITSILTQKIESVTGVSGISNVSSNFDASTRSYSFTAQVTTEYGTTTTVSTTA